MAGQKRGREEQERHGIRLPGSLLDELKGSNGDGDDTSRFNFGEGSYTKKQKTILSRKDKRKQDREAKKKTKTQKSNTPKPKIQSQPQKTQSASKPKKEKTKKSVKFAEGTKEKDASGDEEDFGGFSDDDQDDEEDVMPFGEDDSLSEGDFEDFDEEDFDDDDDEEEDEDQDHEEEVDDNMTAGDTMKALMALKAKKAGNSNGSSVNDKKSKKPEESQTVEDTMAALKAAKAAKANKSKDEPQTAEDTFAALKAAKAVKMNKANEEPKSTKESKSKVDKKKAKKEKEEKYERFISPEDDAWIKRYDEDVKYYAEKLGLKGNKLKPSKDDDGIGSLLDGLDFLDEYDYDKEMEGDYSGEEESGFEEEEEVEEDIESEGQDEDDVGDEEDGDDNEDGEQFDNPFSSDDEINSSDFDSDIDPEAEDEDEGDVMRPAPKENPYVAPVAPTSKYIPPALRQRLQAGDSEEITRIKKSIKGPLNKLSEANTLTIVNQINSVYSESPRQLVTECLTTVILESIVQQATLLDQFVIQHAALAAAIYRLQGVEFGAHFTQTLVEKYEEHYEQGRSKEAGNMLTLLTACYSFQMISCKLLYNIIETLIKEITEMNSELLLRLVKNAGQQLRNDDPNALKEIIITLHANVSQKDTNTRTKFLVETITNLKNNKSRFNNEVAQQLVTRMKKVLATINNNKFHDPLHVSLDDIHNVKTKGKWWLVGSAWKGNSANVDGSNGKDEELYDKDEMNDIIDNAEPNWMELARAQRMNTDIRRAIFISIMSSQDFLEAFTKLDKLRLKRNQEREIPKILLHCVSIEKVSNPYYSLLAIKLCSSHSLRKTFQFCFWDFLKDLEGEDDESGDEDYFKNLNSDLVGQDDQYQLQRILNSGKFFGALIAEGSLPLHSLKNINFLTINSDTSLFIEILMVTFFDKIGKKSEVSLFGQGSKKSKASDLKFQDNLLVGIIAKCETQKAMLRGLQYFLQEKVKSSDIVSGKKQQKRVDWGVDFVCDIADEYLK